MGRGKFSTVHKVQNKINQNFYALKIIEKNNLTSKEKIILQNEETIMKVLSHSNIIQLYESWETHSQYFYVIELIKGKDLFEYVYQKEYLSEKETSFIIRNILNGLQQIQMSGIIHRDLKPENIMLEINKVGEISKVKIVDFGFAIFEEAVNEKTDICGTKNYMAPEILKGELYTKKSDMFSIGVILYFCISGELPFYSDEDFIITHKTIEGEYELDDEFFSNVSEEAKDLIRKLLETDVEKRISIEEALLHDFVINKGFLLEKNEFFKKANEYDLGNFI